MGLIPHLHNVASPYISRTLFLIGHIGCLIAWYRMFFVQEINARFWLNILVLAVYEVIGGFGITAAAHRLWSHRSYEANTLFRSILMIINCIAFQGELFYWVRDHRVHHKFSDTAADPHNIKRGFFFSHMGWLLTSRTPENIAAMEQIPMQDVVKDPVIQFQMDWYPYLCLVMRLLIPLWLGYTITEDIWFAFYANVCLGWTHSLHQTFLVNSAAHSPQFGYRPYNDGIPPTEVSWVSVLAIGEGHHNFHHSYPNDYATSELGWTQTSNPTKWFIDFATSLGWVSKRTRFIKGSDGSFHAQEISGYVGKDD